jgi:hypothetical protein
MFPIKNGLKGDALLPLLFNFTLEYSIKKVQANQDALKLNGTHNLSVYANCLIFITLIMLKHWEEAYTLQGKSQKLY